MNVLKSQIRASFFTKRALYTASQCHSLLLAAILWEYIASWSHWRFLATPFLSQQQNKLATKASQQWALVRETFFRISSLSSNESEKYSFWTGKWCYCRKSISWSRTLVKHTGDKGQMEMTIGATTGSIFFASTSEGVGARLVWRNPFWGVFWKNHRLI